MLISKLRGWSADRGLAKLGFEKDFDLPYIVQYVRYNQKFNYHQIVEIVHKGSGRHLINSYQRDVNSEGFNNSVGLTGIEFKLLLRKMKSCGWYSKQPLSYKEEK